MISVQAQHQKADQVQDWGVAVPEVPAEGRLAIGAGGYEPPRDGRPRRRSPHLGLYGLETKKMTFSWAILPAASMA